MCAERRHTMDQYQIIENLIDLYSPDDEVRLEALLAKKNGFSTDFMSPIPFYQHQKMAILIFML